MNDLDVLTEASRLCQLEAWEKKLEKADLSNPTVRMLINTTKGFWQANHIKQCKLCSQARESYNLMISDLQILNY